MLREAEGRAVMAQPYPWRNGPGADWSTDEAWAILDEIPAGILPDEWLAWRQDFRRHASRPRRRARRQALPIRIDVAARAGCADNRTPRAQSEESKKTTIAIALGAVLGAAGVTAINAQTKPPAFLVADITVTDEAKFKAWGERIGPTFPKHGGKYIARGGTVIPVTGSALTELPKRAVLVQFENLDKAKEWDASADAKAAREADGGNRGATFRTYIVEGSQ